MEYNNLFKNSPNYVPGTMAGFKVADRFARATGVSAETMLGLNELGLAITFIRPSVINSNSVTYNVALAMHETLHSLGFEDDFIKDALGISQKAASVDITKAFANDCFGVTK
jgi:hypothetical protein